MVTGIIIADDHPLVRSGIRTTLAQQAGFEVLAETRNPALVLDLVRRHRAGVLIMDVQLSGQDTAEIVQEIRAAQLACRILIFSRLSESPAVVRMVKAGIQGFISKNVDCDVLLEAIRAVAKGNSYFSQEAANQLSASLHRGEAKGKHQFRLTRQEKKILQQATNGSTNGEIASNLFITERTVEFHMSNVLHKLGAKRRLEAVVKAKSLGLL